MFRIWSRFYDIAPETFYINCKPYPTDKYVRPFVFTDYAELYPYKGKGLGSENHNNNDILWSAGVGLRFQLPYDVVMKVAYGFQLHDNDYETHDNGDWSLEFRFSPDFNKFFE